MSTGQAKGGNSSIEVPSPKCVHFTIKINHGPEGQTSFQILLAMAILELRFGVIGFD